MIVIGTNYILNIYSDSGFTNLLGSSTGTTNNPTGLRHLVFKNRSQPNSPLGSQTIEVDDLQFFNNITGQISDTEWLLRAKVSVQVLNQGDGTNKEVKLGIFDKDETADSTTNQDGLYMVFFTDGGGTPENDLRLHRVNNSPPDTGSG